MKSNKKNIVFTIYLLTNLICNAQTTNSDFDTLLKNISLIKPVEKVFVHTDKSHYSVGENIWYKIYLTDGLFEQPSELSKVVYVQLLAPDLSIIETQKIKITNGTGYGDFSMQDEYGEGVYEIKAYSNWMRNDKEFLFTMDIPVYDFRLNEFRKHYSYNWNIKEDLIELNLNLNKEFLKSDTSTRSKPSLSILLDSVEYSSIETDTAGQLSYKFSLPKRYYRSMCKITIGTEDNEGSSLYRRLEIRPPLEAIELAFFPEGGYLANGVISNLAFKAIGPDGLSRDVSGIIVDESNETVSTFETIHKGMGFIPFRPEKDKSYRAIIFSNNDTLPYPLPATSKMPFILSARQSKNFVSLIIRKNPNIDTSNNPVLIAQTGNKVVYSAVADASKGFASLNISKDIFPEGIIQFTVFDMGIPVSERLIFIEKESPKVVLSTNKRVFNQRDHVKIKLQVTESIQDEVRADLSVSAVDITHNFLSYNRENIRSYLLLNSDLKGNVEEPGYYFNKKNKNRTEYLDILMMTQGWSRFVWDSLLQDEIAVTPNGYKIERGLMLPGILKKLINENKAVEKGKVTLVTKGDTQDIYTTSVNEKGEFTFTNMEIYGNVPVTLFGTNKKGRSLVSFQLDTSYYVLKESNRPFKLPFSIEAEEMKKQYQQSEKAYQVSKAYADSMKTILLDEVTVKGQGISKIEKDRIKYNKIYKRIDNRIDMDDIPASETAPTIFDLLRGRIPGFVYVEAGAGSGPSISLRGESSGTPMFIIDGVTTDVSAIMSLSMNDIDHIDVLKQVAAGIYGGQGMGGVIAVYTKKGEEREPLPETGEYSFTFKGYNVAREFYSPNYKVNKKEHIRPDLRSTIYWNPKLITDKKGRAEMDFYTADQSGIINVEIQGLSKEGEKIYQNFIFEVISE